MKTSILAVLAAASLAWASAGPAAAGKCDKTNKTSEIYRNVKVRTIVKNKDSSMNYKVTIKSNGTIREGPTTLKPGDSIEDNDDMNARYDPVWDMAIRVYPADGEAFSGCYYNVSAEKDCAHRDSYCDSKSTWRIGGAGYVVCSGAWEVTCDKTFSGNKNRWTTTFTIVGGNEGGRRRSEIPKARRSLNLVD